MKEYIKKTDNGFIAYLEKIRLSRPSTSLRDAINNAIPLLTFGFNEQFNHFKYNVPIIEFKQLKNGELMYRWNLESVFLPNGGSEILEFCGWFSTMDFESNEINRFKKDNETLPLIFNLHSELELMYHNQIKIDFKEV